MLTATCYKALVFFAFSEAAVIMFCVCEINFYKVFAIRSYKQILTAEYLLKVTRKELFLSFY